MKRVAESTLRAARGRPRSKRAREAILQAALSLLDEGGYRALTIDRIAAEAGVGKQTIYRWWRSKAEVVLEAFTAYAESHVPAPDTGSLLTDLQAFLRDVVDGFGGVSAPTIRALMAETLVNTEFAAAFHEIFALRRGLVLLEVFRRAYARNEIAETTDVRFALDLVYGPVWNRFLNGDPPLDHRFAEQLAAAVVAGLNV